MFNDIGNKLQKLAQILFWIFAALGTIVFFTGLAGCVANIQYGLDDIDTLSGLIRMVSAAVFILYAYTFAAVLFAFGKLVMDVEKLKEARTSTE